MAEFPEKIFKLLDFTSLPEKSLVQLIKNDDLQMREVEIWDHVLKWGLAQKPALNPTLNSTQNPTQNPILLPDPDTWSGDNFKMIEINLQNWLSWIRFFSLSSEKFSQKVHPYKNS